MRETVVFLLLALAVASPAGADEKTEAKRHFDAGVSLLKAEDYEGAVASFEASLELYPTKTALFNLANCYKALKRYDEALAALSRLRRDFAGKLGAEMEAEAIAIEKEIENLVGSLMIEVDRPGAAVLVDGREVGVSPLPKPVLLSPGSHEVTAELPGVEFGAEKVRMLAGRELSVRLEGKGGAAAPTPAGPHPDPLPGVEGAGTGADEGGSIPSISSIPSIDQGPTPPRVGEGPGEGSALSPAWFWTGLGATAAFGAVSLGMNFAVRGQKDELATDADLEQAERMQSAGIAFLALTGAAAVTTAVLAFFTDWGGETAADADASIQSMSIRHSPQGDGGPSISSIPSIPQPPLPSFFATDDSAGLGVTGRF